MVDLEGSTTILSLVEARCSSGAHHWLISRPDGPISAGVCKWCHAHRDFSNEVSRRYTSQNRPAPKPSPSQ